MKRRYPVKTILLISLLTSIDYSARLNYRLIAPSTTCQLADSAGTNAVYVIDTTSFEGRSIIDRLNLKEYQWFAVSFETHNSEVFDFEAMTFVGELIETSQGMLSRLVGISGGDYYVFDSPEGKVLMMSAMLRCSG